MFHQILSLKQLLVQNLQYDFSWNIGLCKTFLEGLWQVPFFSCLYNDRNPSLKDVEDQHA
jgi:hypothetical protein